MSCVDVVISDQRQETQHSLKLNVLKDAKIFMLLHCPQTKLAALFASPSLYFGHAGHRHSGSERSTVIGSAGCCSTTTRSPGARPFSTQSTRTCSMSTLDGAPLPT